MAELDSNLVAPTSTNDVDTSKGLIGKEVAPGIWVWAPENLGESINSAKFDEAQVWTKAQSPEPFAATTEAELTAGESHFQTTSLSGPATLTFAGTFKPGTAYILEVTANTHALTVAPANAPNGFTQPARDTFHLYTNVMGDNTPYVVSVI